MVTAWLFDVDGTVTHPEIKQVNRQEIIDFIAERLKIEEPVALVTGRSLLGYETCRSPYKTINRIK